MERNAQGDKHRKQAVKCIQKVRKVCKYREKDKKTKTKNGSDRKRKAER